MDVGSPFAVKVFQLIHAFVEKVSGKTFTLKYKTDEYDTYKEVSVSTGAAFQRFETDNMGHRLKIRIEVIQASASFELKALQVQYDQQELVV